MKKKCESSKHCPYEGGRKHRRFFQPLGLLADTESGHASERKGCLSYISHISMALHISRFLPPFALVAKVYF